MSIRERDTVVYYPLRDLTPVRIVCNHGECGAVTELDPSRIEAVMKKTGGCCPVCGKPFTKPSVEGGADVVTMLARTLLALRELSQQLRIELPAKITERPSGFPGS